MTKRKHNDQFPGTLDTTVESLLALCLEMCQPWVHSECWIQALPSGTTQPGGEDGKESIPASWAGTVVEQSPGGGGSLELWLLTQTEQGKGGRIIREARQKGRKGVPGRENSVCEGN